MSKFTQVAARLDVRANVDDQVRATVTVTDGTDPVDISAWTFGVVNCTATVVSGSAGTFQIVWPTGTVRSSSWSVQRSVPNARTLIAGTLNVDSSRGPSDVDDVTLQLVDADGPITLTLAGGGAGGGGSSVIVQDDGTSVGTAETLNLVGATVSLSGSVATITVTGGASPASTVESETGFGQGSAVGTGTEYARNDHTHGTPALGTSGTTAAAGNDARLSDARTPTAHDLAGALHNASTLAALNAKVSDATLDDASGSRDPNAHTLGGAAHSADTLANLNAKVSDATLDDSSASRTPSAHAASHEPGGADALAVDAVAGTGSLRTLGTGAVQAAAGDHAHSGTSEAVAATPNTLALRDGAGRTKVVDGAAAGDVVNKGQLDTKRNTADAIDTADLADNAVTGAKMESGVQVWWFDAGADASAARPAGAAATDIVIWTNVPSVPTNLGARDQWEDES